MNRARGAMVALAALICSSAALAALVTAEVVARGKLVPSGGEGVRRVRVWGAIEFYISSETARPSIDLVTTIALVALASAIGFACVVLLVSGVRSRLTRCLALVFAGAAYLAADELLAIHESVGHNLQFLRNFPGVKRPDDVVFAAYALPAGAFLWRFRDVLASVRTARLLFAAGTALALLAVVFDLLSAPTGLEDGVEVLAASFLGGGFICLAAVRVPEALITAKGRVHISDHFS